MYKLDVFGYVGFQGSQAIHKLLSLLLSFTNSLDHLQQLFPHDVRAQNFAELLAGGRIGECFFLGLIGSHLDAEIPADVAGDGLSRLQELNDFLNFQIG